MGLAMVASIAYLVRAQPRKTDNSAMASATLAPEVLARAAQRSAIVHWVLGVGLLLAARGLLFFPLPSVEPNLRAAFPSMVVLSDLIAARGTHQLLGKGQPARSQLHGIGRALLALFLTSCAFKMLSRLLTGGAG
jgi:hypothetical protein